jgi:hypothetical protein
MCSVYLWLRLNFRLSVPWNALWDIFPSVLYDTSRKSTPAECSLVYPCPLASGAQIVA